MSDKTGRAADRRAPFFVMTISGPPGPGQRRLLQTLREAGYWVSEPRPLGPGGGRVEVEVRAPYGEING